MIENFGTGGRVCRGKFSGINVSSGKLYMSWGRLESLNPTTKRLTDSANEVWKRSQATSAETVIAIVLLF